MLKGANHDDAVSDIAPEREYPSRGLRREGMRAGVRAYSNDMAATRRLLGEPSACVHISSAQLEEAVRPAAEALLGDALLIACDVPSPAPLWRHLLISGHAPSSQYERLIGAARAGQRLPHGLACAAYAGDGFLGFHGRSWTGSRGNIHLTVHLAPDRAIERFESVFTALAAVSVIDALDGIAGLHGRPRIRWVNDVVLDDGKVAGVLAWTQTQGARVLSVVLGIGINVEVTPCVPSTPFVPAATSVREHALEPSSVQLASVLDSLLRALAHNYDVLLEHGGTRIIDQYRARSLVVGKDVAVSTDDGDGEPRIYASGRVRTIGPGLELWLDGRERPITSGRLVVEPQTLQSAPLIGRAGEGGGRP
jgi:biotin-[acetyl-CoA-carboxylase] ligase BirA-like protein